jgi:hypothetical protein
VVVREAVFICSVLLSIYMGFFGIHGGLVNWVNF